MNSAVLEYSEVSPKTHLRQHVNVVIWDATVLWLVLDLCVENVVICVKFHMALTVWSERRLERNLGFFFHPFDYEEKIRYLCEKESELTTFSKVTEQMHSTALDCAYLLSFFFFSLF